MLFYPYTADLARAADTPDHRTLSTLLERLLPAVPQEAQAFLAEGLARAGAPTPADNDAVMGVIRCAPEYARPSDQGNNVYLRIEKDFDAVLAKVEQLGGKIVVPKMDARDFGQFAWILDSEGNRIGLNQPRQ